MQSIPKNGLRECEGGVYARCNELIDQNTESAAVYFGIILDTQTLEHKNMMLSLETACASRALDISCRYERELDRCDHDLAMCKKTAKVMEMFVKDRSMQLRLVHQELVTTKRLHNESKHREILLLEQIAQLKLDQVRHKCE
jgi:hypothetical protein